MQGNYKSAAQLQIKTPNSGGDQTENDTSRPNSPTFKKVSFNWQLKTQKTADGVLPGVEMTEIPSPTRQ